MFSIFLLYQERRKSFEGCAFDKIQLRRSFTVFEQALQVLNCGTLKLALALWFVECLASSAVPASNLCFLFIPNFDPFLYIRDSVKS